MISKIYSSNKPLFKVGERKGHSKKTIEQMVDERLRKTKSKNKSKPIPKKKKNLDEWFRNKEQEIRKNRKW